MSKVGRMLKALELLENDIYKRLSLMKTFREFSEVKGECIEWMGKKSYLGYGYIVVNSSTMYVHRLSWAFANSGIDKIKNKRMLVCHRCDNPKCFNPQHLFEGNHKINSIDMVSKGRNFIAKGSLQGSSKLTEKEVVKILVRLSKGEYITSIAKDYNVARSTIGRINSGERWKHCSIPIIEEPTDGQ